MLLEQDMEELVVRTMQIRSTNGCRCHLDQCIIGMFELWQGTFFNSHLERLYTTTSVLVLLLDHHLKHPDGEEITYLDRPQLS
tara:strand:+ start:148 stop:396 length:249 start_codon:yes stop_codon:yes gene_type:complete